MNGLIRALQTGGSQLSARVIEEMYESPFWSERFGERGRRHAGQDGDYHILYLVQALVADDPAVLTGYARWLQSVLTTRGMCSRHLDENFERLARAIQQEIPDAQRAVDYLESARRALRYESGPGREIQDATPKLAAETVEELYRRHPAWLSERGHLERDTCESDISYHLSYLADAAALGRAELFTSYVAWIDGFLERRHVPTQHLRECLQLLLQRVSRARDFSAAARAASSEALLSGLQVLGSERQGAATGTSR